MRSVTIVIISLSIIDSNLKFKLESVVLSMCPLQRPFPFSRPLLAALLLQGSPKSVNYSLDAPYKEFAVTSGDVGHKRERVLLGWKFQTSDISEKRHSIP